MCEQNSWYDEYLERKHRELVEKTKQIHQLSIIPSKNLTKAKPIVFRGFSQKFRTHDKPPILLNDKVVWNNIGEFADERMNSRFERRRLRERQTWQRAYNKERKKRDKLFKPQNRSPIITNWVWISGPGTMPISRRKIELQRNDSVDGRRFCASHIFRQNDGVYEKYVEWESMKIVKIRRLFVCLKTKSRLRRIMAKCND